MSGCPGLSLARNLLGRFSQNPSYLWCFLLVICHPLTTSLLLGYKFPLVLTVFGIEPSFILRSLFPYATVPNKNLFLLLWLLYNSGFSLTVRKCSRCRRPPFSLSLSLFCSLTLQPSSNSKVVVGAGGNESLRSWNSREKNSTLCSGELWFQGGSTLLIFFSLCSAALPQM